MALVCDIKSGESYPENAEDLEDGEIEDDDEGTEIPADQPAENPTPQSQSTTSSPSTKPPVEQAKAPPEKIDRDKPRDRSKEKRERRHNKDKESRHMTEAEKSILHLRRKERMEREKWNKYRKDQQIVTETQDDFAINLEKTMASILKKERVTSDEDKEEDRRTNKRKKKGRDSEHKTKQRKIDSPKSEDLDDMMNIFGGNLEPKLMEKEERLRSPRSELSYDSEYSSDQSKLEEKGNRRKDNRRDNKKANKNKNKNRDRNFKRDRSRDRKGEPVTDAKGICIFYLNGKCNKSDCIYSHEAIPPMKLELCKFYLMDCCAKGENCSYMHSEFPCKFYHMGLPCNMGDDCKFAHGKPLSDVSDTKVKQTEKMIRNRPSRWQEADSSDSHTNVNVNFTPFNFAQDQDMRINSNGDIDMRTLPPHPLTSLPQPLPSSLPLSSDLIPMDVTKMHSSSGDVDIRNLNQSLVNFASDVDIRLQSTFEVQSPTVGKTDQDQRFYSNQDVDIRHQDVDIRHLIVPPVNQEVESTEDSRESRVKTAAPSLNIPSNLPKMQRELYMRIQSQQRENPIQEDRRDSGDEQDIQDTNWYSDDDDDDDENRLTIKDDNEEFGSCRDEEHDHKEEKTEEIIGASVPNFNTAPIKASEMVEKLGDLSKINITADITKLLNTLSALPALPSLVPPQESEEPLKDPRDPRPAFQPDTSSPGRSPIASFTVSKSSSKTMSDPRLSQDPRNKSNEAPRDPRRGGGGIGSAASAKIEKLSIYEQGGLDLEDIDLRIEAADDFKGRQDVDLRTLSLPFKGMENYTPATEIDASMSSHLPIQWKVLNVEIPRPDYSGLKLSINDAEKTGDPRLRKIFRLSVEEKDTPTSPKASPRAGIARIDPRLRKTEDSKPLMDSPIMTYNQQLNTLQSSAFYQSLTSNQKLMLNTELASRADQTGSHDPMLNSLLTNLNIIPGMTASGLQNQNANLASALTILQNLNKVNNPMAQNGILGPNNMMNPNQNMMNPNQNMMNPLGQGVLQPGLLGAAPGIPNLPQDFPMNFDLRNQNGLLGNGPQFQNFDPVNNGPGPGGFQNYPNDDFYPQDNNQGGFRGGNPSRNDRGGNFNNRERRRGGRNNFGRNQGNRNQFRRNQGGGRSNRAHTPP